MSFPLEVTAQINSHNGNFTRKFTLNRGLTVLLGPNGSGKTHLLRGLKQSLNQHTLARSILGERSKIFSLVVEEENLVVSIESKILNVKGFPVALGKDDDVLKCINVALATNA